MPSLVPKYEYDIFISYRHNDNLDGWVTNFVQSLEKELKATCNATIELKSIQNRRRLAELKANFQGWI